MRYKKRRRATPELIDAIRRCAEEKQTMVAAAKTCSTKIWPLTHRCVAGIATRNGIRFTNVRGPDTKPRKLRTDKQRRIPMTNYRHAKPVRAAAPGCSWGGCECSAEPGGLFCTGHRRRALT